MPEMLQTQLTLLKSIPLNVHCLVVMMESSKVIWRVRLTSLFLVAVNTQTLLQVKEICKE